MLNAITLPTWLVDVWTVYGEYLQPILVTLLTTIVTWLSIKFRSDAKTNAAKADIQIEALRNVANREDNKPQLEEQTLKIESLNSAVICLAEMFNLVFQNSDLDPEIKLTVTSLMNKLKYGTEDDLVAMLENDNAKLQEQINELTAKLNETARAAVAETSEIKRQRR